MCNTQSNMLEILTTIVITITSFVVIVKTVQLSTKKELFLKVYFPFYKILSPLLYKKLSVEELQMLLSELDNKFSQAEYLPFFISEHIDYLREGLSKGEVWQDTYEELCRYIDIKCNSLSNLLGYPKRTLSYRIRHNQFANIYEKWIFTAIFLFAKTVVFVFTILFGVTILAWLKIVLANILSLPL